jgi:mannose-1-phosphate guanylyltransferase
MSRTHTPKQFLDILGIGQTLFQMTLSRFRKICPVENIVIVTNEKYKDLVIKQAPKLIRNRYYVSPPEEIQDHALPMPIIRLRRSIPTLLLL